MAHVTHEKHDHTHGENCGHPAVRHEGHTDYLHDGHLHHAHDGHTDEHEIASSSANPADCTNGHACASHSEAHKHGDACGHESLPHAGHTDYVVAGHLHNPHGSHCDNHGNV